MNLRSPVIQQAMSSLGLRVSDLIIRYAWIFNNLLFQDEKGLSEASVGEASSSKEKPVELAHSIDGSAAVFELGGWRFHLDQVPEISSKGRTQMEACPRREGPH